MAVVISGTNNSDKITATDGLIDLLSSVNFASEVTVPSFKVGSDIQIGNAGIITATTLVGNVQGNINHTSNLLLQISGSEKFRVGTSGQLGIGGANYGTSGQVLTSGGSSSAATWSTIASDKITEGNTEAEVIDTGSDGHFKVTTEGTERLRITSTGSVGIGEDAPVAKVHIAGSNYVSVGGGGFDSNVVLAITRNFAVGHSAGLALNSGTSATSFIHLGDADDPDIGKITYDHSNNSMSFTTNATERLRIASNGQVSISNDGTTDGLLTIKGNSDQVGTPSIRLLDGSDTREVSITNISGDFVASVHGNDNAIHGHIKMFESGQFDVNNGGASGSNTNRLRIDTSGRVGINRTPALASSKLEVGGADNYPLINVEASGATGGMGIGGAALKFFYGTSEKLLIHSDGQIQAGTSGPTYLKYTGSAVPTNNNCGTLLGSNNIGLIGQYSSLNMPFDHSTATASGAWWMLGRSAGTTNEWGLYTRSGGQSNLLSVWKVIGNSNGTTDYQTFSTGSNSERLRITSGGILQQSATGGDNQFVSTRTGATYNDGDYYFQLFAKNNSSTNMGALGIVRDTGNNNSRMTFYTADGGTNKERARIHRWGGLQLRNIIPPYGSSEPASRYIYSFHRSGTYNTFWVEIKFNTPGSYCLDLRMGGYSNRHMHYTFQGYVYSGNDFASAAAIDSGNGPQRYYSNQGTFGSSYGTIIRFGFSSMSATHPVVHYELSFGAAGGDSLAEITNMLWS